MSKDLKKNKKKIVCMGGGNAMPRAVLSELKKHPVSISAICAMLDSGGSAGRLRKDYGIVSPGDIRRAFLALANVSPAVENLFNYRFEAGELKGHNFANLFITALELSTNNYEKTIDEIKRILNVEHEVLPATLEKSEVCAVLENGETIVGETNIDIPKHNGYLKIEKIFLEPKVNAYPLSLKAVSEADLIVIGPGDLYSSLAQILLTEGMADAIKKSSAKKIYICNLMAKHGETDNYSVKCFTEKIEELINCSLDYVVYNNKKISDERIKENSETNPELLKEVSINKDLDCSKYIGGDIVLSSGPINHDPEKLIKLILNL